MEQNIICVTTKISHTKLLCFQRENFDVFRTCRGQRKRCLRKSNNNNIIVLNKTQLIWLCITVSPTRYSDEQLVFPHFDSDGQIVFRHELASFEGVTSVLVARERVVQRRPSVQFVEFLRRRRDR